MKQADTGTGGAEPRPAGELHPILTASVAKAAFRTLASRLFWPAVHYILVVLNFFILPQLVARIFRRRYRIVSVDHPLDELIAFDPGKVDIYLSFIELWCRSIALIQERYGRAAQRDVGDFLERLSSAYLQARSVYKRCLSTTRRPAKAANGRFRAMYFFDPHFNCVPSLHIMICCLVCLEIPAVFERRGRCDDLDEIKRVLRRRAVEISDSVIYVKQHSINCIPAALYMVSNSHPRFDRAAGIDFADSLFRGQLPEEQRLAIRDHMVGLYERFLDDPRHGGPDYASVLVDFLDGYAAGPAPA